MASPLPDKRSRLDVSRIVFLLPEFKLLTKTSFPTCHWPCLEGKVSPHYHDFKIANVVQGCAFGGIKGRTQLPDLVDDYMTGKLKVDEFITHRQPLAKINQAFDDMRAGDCIRCVVNMLDEKK